MPRSRTFIGLLLTLFLMSCVAGCGDDPFDGPYSVTILLPDGGTAEVFLPTVCIGVTPSEDAWSTVPGPLKPPEPPVEFNPDANANDSQSSEGHSNGDDDSESEPETGEPTEEEEVEEPDPCVVAPSTCIGNPAPEWALTDFQPQSCGYKATYGMEAFQGHVTFVVLLAAW